MQRVKLQFYSPADDENEAYRFRPRRVRRARPFSEPGPTVSMSFEDTSDEEIRESGVGILEFSPAKAGMDVTPVNYNFTHGSGDIPNKDRKRSSMSFSTLPGLFYLL